MSPPRGSAVRRSRFGAAEMARRLKVLLTVAALSVWGTTAEAIPLLQLDMQGGTYDPVTQSIVAPGGSFTVYAVLTPQNNTTAAELAALLSDTYYVSVAISPQVGSVPASVGSFTFGGTTVNANSTGM